MVISRERLDPALGLEMAPATDDLGRGRMGQDNGLAALGGQLAQRVFVTVIGLGLADDDQIRLGYLPQRRNARRNPTSRHGESLMEDFGRAGQPRVKQDREGARRCGRRRRRRTKPRREMMRRRRRRWRRREGQ